ncbi:serine/threonine protein kinase, CMGC, dual-specificity [Mucor velutinosus]|uniref:Serine/threonine protein kinase, CMGC, dual-specificity n=1 Tax=Mucor velutinosus TaxID=708070 RepID=A0AAN7DLE5_9FUNG|nr:serine/threonine protein kinase, CMGC, dual-specificity [Mucor velutinosus]
MKHLPLLNVTVWRAEEKYAAGLARNKEREATQRYLGPTRGSGSGGGSYRNSGYNGFSGYRYDRGGYIYDSGGYGDDSCGYGGDSGGCGGGDSSGGGGSGGGGGGGGGGGD